MSRASRSLEATEIVISLPQTAINHGRVILHHRNVQVVVQVVVQVDAQPGTCIRRPELQFTGAMGTVDAYKVIMPDIDITALWLSFNSPPLLAEICLRRWELPFRSVFSRPGIHLPHSNT